MGKTIMLVQVLKSVDKMLEEGLRGAEDAKQSVVYFKCAKTLLEKVIEIEEIKEAAAAPKVRTAQQVVVEDFSVSTKEYAIDVSPGKKLIRISDSGGQELSGAIMVEVDGLAMPYNEAVGQTISKTVRVL